MRKLIGLTALLASACSSQKEIKDPVIPNIIIQEREEETASEPQKDDQRFISNDYQNLGEECSKINLESGVYLVKMEGQYAFYRIDVWSSASGSASGKSCTLFLTTPDISATVTDEDCDNSADEVIVDIHRTEGRIGGRIKRSTLESLGYHKHLDQLIEKAQQFACSENKYLFQKYLLEKVLEKENNQKK